MTATIHWAFQAAGAQGEGALSGAERARLAALQVEKRRADFLLGRCTAKAAVAAALGAARPARWRPEHLELPAEPGGAPYVRLAPEAPPIAGFTPGERLPVAVTISHAEGHALGAAACHAPGAPLALGIDLGRIEPRSPALQATFFTGPERAFVAAAPPGEADLRANLVWCAKEAALKVLRLGLTVDTLALTCLPEDTPADPRQWPLDPAEGAWCRFTAACAPGLAGGAVIQGVWRRLGGQAGFVAALAAHAPARPTPAATSTWTW